MAWAAILRAVAVAPLLLLFGACHYAVDSDVPVVSDASRAVDLPLQSGRYCAPDIDGDPDALRESLALGNCLAIEVGAGTLTLTNEDSDQPETATVEVAALSRGAHLAQTYRSEDGHFSLYIVVMLSDSIMVVEVGYLTPEIEALASDTGVTLDLTQEIERLVDGRTGEVVSEGPIARGVYILDGEPDAVLVFLSRLTELVFDEAAEASAGGESLNPVVGVRVGTSPEDSAIDEEAAREKLSAINAALDQAMGLR